MVIPLLHIRRGGGIVGAVNPFRHSMIRLLPAILPLVLAGCGASPETLSRKGVEALNEGRHQRAARLLTKAAEKLAPGPDAAPLWDRIGLAEYRAGDPEAAERAFRRAVDLDPDLYSAHYNLGDLLAQNQRHEEAETHLRRAAALAPERTEALERLATIALRREDRAEAIDLLEQARGRNETSRILTSLAVAKSESAPVDELRSLLQRAVTLDPSHAPAQLNLAALLDQNRLDPEQAITHYEAFLRLEPDTDQIPQIRQRIQIMASRADSGNFARPDPARREVESLLEQAAAAAREGSQEQALHFCLRAGALAGREQRTDLKERAYRAAVALAPGSPRAHFALGSLLREQNRTRSGLDALRTANRLAPTWAGALQATVAAAMEEDETAAARQALERSLEAAGEDANLLLLVGRLYEQRLGDSRQAKRVYRDWLETFPDDPRAEDVRALL